jgi:AcrR family transcriptional regulator
MDRRIQRTKDSLQQALFELIQQKPYEDIQIQEITDTANTARITFYRHYGTKDDLLLDCLEQIYQDLKQVLPSGDMAQIVDLRQTPPNLKLFEFLAQNAPLLRILLTGPKSWLIQERFRHYVVEHLTHEFTCIPHFADLPVVLMVNHIASCVIGNAAWWLMEGCPYSPEYIARLTHTMSLTGVMGMVGRLDFVIPPPPNFWQLNHDSPRVPEEPSETN